MSTTTYLICIDPMNPDAGLRVGSREEFETILQKNKELPRNQKRKFILDSIFEDNKYDDMYMEAPLPKYRKWKQEEKQRARCYKGVENYEFFSLDAVFEASCKDEDIIWKERLVSTGGVGDDAENSAFQDDLIMDLFAWKPWAYDVYLYYAIGKKRYCCKPLAKKYHCSVRTMERNVNALEKHIVSFVKTYYKDYLYRERTDGSGSDPSVQGGDLHE